MRCRILLNRVSGTFFLYSANGMDRFFHSFQKYFNVQPAAVCLLLGFLCMQPVHAKEFVAPETIPDALIAAIDRSLPEFLQDLERVLAAETHDLFILVDKKHALSSEFVPHDLIPLKGDRAYAISRKDLSLTRQAEAALQEMALAARKDGVTLLVSSSYRSYQYQKNLFARYVRESGEAEAERFSARAGTSQHQLGTVVDFGSISDEFAQTKAGKWVLRHASEYGWSLSFPKGYENVTGYVWESWHYRYIGKEACAFQKKWFDDIQQYMLEFIDAWKKEHTAA